MDPVVEVPHQNLHVVLGNRIIDCLGSSLLYEPILKDLADLISPFLNIYAAVATFQMAVNETERSVLNQESNQCGSLVAYLSGKA